MSNPVKIKQILAYDDDYPNMPPTVLDVDIERTEKDTFP